MVERRAKLLRGECDEFKRIMENRHWEKLAKPDNYYNELIVREFYSNAYLHQHFDKNRFSWIRGKKVGYDRQTP